MCGLLAYEEIRFLMGRGVSASGCNHCLEDGLTNDEMHRVQIVQ